MQDRFKERAGSHVSSGVFSGAFVQWGLPMSLAASLVVGMAWLHFMHGGRIERSASTSTWSFLAKETSEAPIAQTALTRSAPQVPQSRVRPSADAMGSGKLARVEALQETWDVEDTLQSGNAEAPRWLWKVPMVQSSAPSLGPISGFRGSRMKCSIEIGTSGFLPMPTA